MNDKIVLQQVNGGSGGGGGGGGSMDVATPPGTLFDSTGWANEVGSFGGREIDPFGGSGGYQSGRDSYGNAERLGGGISSIRSSLDANSVRLVDKWVRDGAFSETLDRDILSLDFAVEGKIPLGAGFEFTASPGGDVGLGWKAISLTTEEFSLTTPSPGLAATVGGRFEGKLFIGLAFGPAQVRMVFDLNNFRNEMEEWHRQATRKIYGSFPDLGGSGFNFSDLP